VKEMILDLEEDPGMTVCLEMLAMTMVWEVGRDPIRFSEAAVETV